MGTDVMKFAGDSSHGGQGGGIIVPLGVVKLPFRRSYVGIGGGEGKTCIMITQAAVYRDVVLSGKKRGCMSVFNGCGIV